MRMLGRAATGIASICIFLFLAAGGGYGDVADGAARKEERRPAVTFYVATDGNDAGSGNRPDAKGDGLDGPLATLEAARQRIRELKAKGPLPAGGAEVVLRGGTYYLSKTFRLGPEDSGTAEAPVTYRAAEGEKVCLVGGRPVTGFVPHKGAILKANLAAQGLRGADFNQMYFDGKRQHMARWPNFDPQNPTTGGWALVDGEPIKTRYFEDLPGEDRRTLTYKEIDAREWSRPEEGEVFVFPRYNWWNNIVKIAAIDRSSRTIKLAADASYIIRPEDRYFFQNFFEELDAPGEWYLDRKSDTLYFWPPSPLADGHVHVPVLDRLVDILPRTSHVTVRGFTLECCKRHAVVLRDTVECLIAGNTIRNAGDYHGSAVVIQGGVRNGVVGNDIYDIGRDGITIDGGDRKTLTAAGNTADNNAVHHVGMCYKQGVGVFLRGVGNRASHNLIRHCPRMGLWFFGNNLVMEYNHIHHVVLETEDVGAINTGGRDWISSRGSVVRYNYVHDIVGLGKRDGRWVSPHPRDFVNGIYLDDNSGGVDVIGNIVTSGARAPMYLHNARDCRIENNIFVGGPNQQVEYAGWTKTHPFLIRFLPEMIKGYDSVAGQPAWSKMPNMDVRPDQAILPDGTMMSGNELQRNIFYCRGKTAFPIKFRNVSLSHNKSDYNLAYTFGRELQIEVKPSPKGAPDAKASNMTRGNPAADWPKWWCDLGQDQHSTVGDPQFVDPDKADYRLKPTSPALKLGFKPIPVEKIGPYPSPLRASWPIAEH